MTKSEWQPISTAPKDGSIIRLRDADKIYLCAMAWDKKEKKWCGMAFSAMGSSKTYWDEDFIKIAEWQELK
jgi:hypothetical protein